MDAGWMVLCSAASLLPAGLIVSNLRQYRRLPPPVSRMLPGVSVLIPARNEEANIRAALESVLGCEGVDVEVLVWDDGSTDRTAEIVGEIEARDPRVRLVAGSPPPEGWAGKPFGCWSLANAARGEVLLFMDADVRLRGGDSLARMAAAFSRGGLDLLSGVPLQKVETLSEVMVVPQIHFVLLGFLPMERMRMSKDPRFAAACGQLMLFRRSSYMEVGGHSRATRSFHEGLALARVFRREGRVTDLFDATDVAVCRMYSGFGEVWRGFAKNAHEGLASPGSVLPFSLLLFFGQVFPLLVLFGGNLSRAGAGWAFLALLGAWFSRAMLAVRFSHPLSGVLLQPLAVAFLLLNQWYGAARFWLGKPVGWRGRTLIGLVGLGLCSGAVLAAEPARCPEIRLEDQHGVRHEVRFPRERPVYIVASTRSGTGKVGGWVKPVVEKYGDKVEIFGLADVRGIPQMFRGAVRLLIRDGTPWPVLMDWEAQAIPGLCTPGANIEVMVVEPDGRVRFRHAGESSPEGLERVFQVLDEILRKRVPPRSK
jgi:hypothetical protein